MVIAAEVTRRVLLVFNGHNLAMLRRGAGGKLEATFAADGTDEQSFVSGGVDAATPAQCLPIAPVKIGLAASGSEVWFALCEECECVPVAAAWESRSIEELESGADAGREIRSLLPFLKEHAIRIPYLNHSEAEFIYRFRTEKQRNRMVYQGDDPARTLYSSELCEVIKRLRRTKEGTADAPASLDFGAVQYVLPSHFGFCLGVQNAIERAYETIAEHPGSRVFMLSELIHNPFVNDDLQARGLRYLQSDKGVPVNDPLTGKPYWDGIGKGDIVIIPAFGATDEDKRRLILKGIALNRFDATCMLVEKVWKAARRYGRLGYTVVIHGKHEHEETKATFSNSAKHAPSIILRDLHEAKAFSEVILAPDEAEARRRFSVFHDKCSEGFDPVRDLARLAVVNQTTLLRNETITIIDMLEETFARKFGRENVADHLFAESRGDTLCYATQVNQDALQRALEMDIDAAIVVGGRNSSNTYQLYRICEARFGERAFYIQSEGNLLSAEELEHYVYPYDPKNPAQGRLVRRPFLPDRAGVRILVTGGASCPDGLIQQIIARINGLFPPDSIRPMDAVLADFEADAVKGN